MGHRPHLPMDGRKVGLIRIDDVRAKFARITLDGVDVTRGWGPERDIVVAAHDVEGWIGTLNRTTKLIVQRRGDVRITWEPFKPAGTQERN